MTSAGADTQRLYFGCRDPYKGGPLYALRAGGAGDQRPAGSRKAFETEAWAATGAAPGMPSPLAAGGCVYVLHNSILTCCDAASGREL